MRSAASYGSRSSRGCASSARSRRCSNLPSASWRTWCVNASRRRRFDLARFVQIGGVSLDRAHELVDSLTAHRLRRDELGNPARPLQHLHHRSNLAPQLVGHWVIGLVDDEHVGDLHDAGLEHLNRIAAAGLQRDDRRLRELGDGDFALADADRLDQHETRNRMHPSIARRRRSLRRGRRDGRGSPSNG